MINIDRLFFKTQPHKKQLDLVKAAVSRRENAFLCEMGSGKSKIAIDTVSNKAFRGEISSCIIVAPEGVQKQWMQTEIPKHCPLKFNTFLWENKDTKKYRAQFSRFLLEAKKQNKYDISFFCVNVEAFSAQKAGLLAQRLLDMTRCCIIVDEATRIKNPKARCTRTLLSLSRSAHATMILTGTPVAQGVLSLYSMYNFLRPAFFQETYTAYQDRYALFYFQQIRRNGRTYRIKSHLTRELWSKIKDDLSRLLEYVPSRTVFEENRHFLLEIALKHNTTIKTVWEVHKQKQYSKFCGVEELKKRIAPVTLRASREDMGEMPGKVYVDVPLTLSPAKAKVIKTLSKQAYARYTKELSGGKEEKELLIKHKATLITRILQICGGLLPVDTNTGGASVVDVEVMQDPNAKVQYIVGNLDELADRQAIVWTAYKKEAELVAEELKKHVSVALYTGDVPKTERQKAVDAFNTGGVQILVCTEASAAFGHNWPQAKVQYWYSRMWSIEKRLQAEDRSYRIGITEPVVYIDLFYSGTVEQYVIQSLKEGRSLNDDILTAPLLDFS